MPAPAHSRVGGPPVSQGLLGSGLHREWRVFPTVQDLCVRDPQ